MPSNTMTSQQCSCLGSLVQACTRLVHSFKECRRLAQLPLSTPQALGLQFMRAA